MTWFKQLAWITRYTSMRPEDLERMPLRDYLMFVEALADILTKESTVTEKG
jgi:hypothetical protein